MRSITSWEFTWLENMSTIVNFYFHPCFAGIRLCPLLGVNMTRTLTYFLTRVERVHEFYLENLIWWPFCLQPTSGSSRNGEWCVHTRWFCYLFAFCARKWIRDVSCCRNRNKLSWRCGIIMRVDTDCNSANFTPYITCNNKSLSWRKLIYNQVKDFLENPFVVLFIIQTRIVNFIDVSCLLCFRWVVDSLTWSETSLLTFPQRQWTVWVKRTLLIYNRMFVTRVGRVKVKEACSFASTGNNDSWKIDQ